MDRRAVISLQQDVIHMLRSPDSNDRSEGGENDLELKNAANGAGARS